MSGTRVLQITLLVLLIVSAAQVLWWFVHQEIYTARVRERLMTLYREEERAAERLLAVGVPAAEVGELFPHLAVSDSPGALLTGAAAIVRPEALETLERERSRHLRQYAWEGSFFVGVLVISMSVLWRALRTEAVLRRRQENFLAAVSHELKSPLASLRLSAETLNLRQPEPEKRRRLVERILADLHRMEDLVAKILDTSRLDEGRLELHPEAVPLAEAVRAELVGREIPAALRLEVSVPEELAVRADPVALRTVLRNLLENALKAVAAGDEAADQAANEVTIKAWQDGGWVRLEVRDTGIGFAPEEARRLFEKFYRTGDELQRRSSGSGLGLYIVQRLVTEAGGAVAAHSAGPGRGATFTVSWPRSDRPAVST